MKKSWKLEYKNIQDLYNNNYSISQIAKIYNVSYDSIRSVIKHTVGLKLSNRKSWINEYKHIQELYKSGYSSGDIAKLYHTNTTIIGQIISNTIGLRNKSEARKLCIKQGKHNAFFIASSKLKRYKENSPRWISDRTKLKGFRANSDEQLFFKEILKERNYTCELTKQIGGKLSIHHIQPVWKYPDLRLEKSNVIVIIYLIHKKFHHMYGWKCDKKDWINFINNKEYLS